MLGADRKGDINFVRARARRFGSDSRSVFLETQKLVAVISRTVHSACASMAELLELGPTLRIRFKWESVI